uniref:Uncharacterized protein n=1 Tax=Timema tahoe TaxID=61484 RepID=A0A7R9IBT1_9NEOP|nr:unnamed protein product [Timema tahoe]
MPSVIILVSTYPSMVTKCDADEATVNPFPFSLTPIRTILQHSLSMASMHNEPCTYPKVDTHDSQDYKMNRSDRLMALLTIEGTVEQIGSRAFNVRRCSQLDRLVALKGLRPYLDDVVTIPGSANSRRRCSRCHCEESLNCVPTRFNFSGWMTAQSNKEGEARERRRAQRVGNRRNKDDTMGSLGREIELVGGVIYVPQMCASSGKGSKAKGDEECVKRQAKQEWGRMNEPVCSPCTIETRGYHSPPQLLELPTNTPHFSPCHRPVLRLVQQLPALTSIF